MKYLYLIIRRIFPKKPISIWKEINQIHWHGDIWGNETTRPTCITYILQDQFGNLKQEKVIYDTTT